MNAIVNPQHPQIRALQSPQDLLPVADLIELCFSATMDEDGKDFLRQMRKAGNAYQSAKWLTGEMEQVSYPLQGFVWVEGNQIVGNLSLIPFIHKQHWYYLIANVAVLPEFRQKGIGKALTQQAIEHIQALGSNETWLQVRDDNPVAYQLYLSLGFEERYRRDTWVSQKSIPPSESTDANIQISSRKTTDWNQQRQWLEMIYPSEIAWNFHFDSNRFVPGIWKDLQRLLEGIVHHHLAARRRGKLLGLATWEPTSHHADTLWLGVDPLEQEETIKSLLEFFRSDFYDIRPVQINYPAHQSRNAFLENGFRLQHTLIWMKYPVK